MASVRLKMREIIFEADTFAGKVFDVGLIASVLASVLVVMLGTVASVDLRYGSFLRWAEWFFTAIFTVEYILRLYSAKSARRYATSFFGVVDLVAVLPSYISLVLPGGHILMTVRILRALRVFRVLDMGSYIDETAQLVAALKASRRRITIFLLAVMTMVVILGSLMYTIESPEAGFTSIPTSVYWAIVTLTTVGYGDISPQTEVGQVVAAVIMIMGYSLIVVPTGFVSVAVAAAGSEGVGSARGAAGSPRGARECPDCKKSGHDADSAFCRHCGAKL